MSNILISGLVDLDANGIYYFNGIHDGYNFYKKENNYLLIYCVQLLPYTKLSAYFIMKYSMTNGSVPILTPKYINFGNNPMVGDWYSLMSPESGEDNDNFDLEYMSSSSISSISSISSMTSGSSMSGVVGNFLITNDERFVITNDEKNIELDI